jgi:radical S-adenosyl methionine domain-containing protein 2
MIPSVNFHFWEPCNMRCKFCFATFQDVKKSILPKGHLPKEKAIEVIHQLAEIGFEKITFVGGEPTLCPWLLELIKVAKEAKLVTMIVTNGSGISDEFLSKSQNSLDWIAISIDSLNTETNLAIGRAINGKKAFSFKEYKEIITRIKSYGFGLKINTVVNQLNYAEDLSELIQFAQPKRWKIFQALPIEGQNDGKIEPLLITGEQFLGFVDNHQSLNGITEIIPESNYDMKGSYAMVDPAGRFYDNENGKHRYSLPILEVGARIAIQQVNFDFEKFVNRGGIYDFHVKKDFPNRITLSGGVASGKTTIGKLLASRLNFNFISIGNRTREFAQSQGLTIAEFQDECLRNPELDKKIDLEFSKECNNKEKLIIDYRLGFKFVKNAFHIYLKISDQVAIDRLKNANRNFETHETLLQRNESFRKQFHQSYNVDFTLPKNYDLIVESEQFGGPEEIVEFIINKITLQNEKY